MKAALYCRVSASNKGQTVEQLEGLNKSGKKVKQRAAKEVVRHE